MLELATLPNDWNAVKHLDTAVNQCLALWVWVSGDHHMVLRSELASLICWSRYWMPKPNRSPETGLGCGGSEVYGYSKALVMLWESVALIANHQNLMQHQMQNIRIHQDPSEASDANDGVSTVRKSNVWRYKNVQHNARLSVSSVKPASSSAMYRTISTKRCRCNGKAKTK